MLLVQVPVTVPPVQVDDFPEGCKRSVKGSMRIRPSSTLEMTKDEYDHLCSKKHRVALGSKLHVVKWKGDEPYETDLSALGKEAKVKRDKAVATAPKRAKDNPTAQQRKKTERAAKVKAALTISKAVDKAVDKAVEVAKTTPAESEANGKSKGKSKAK